LPDLVVVRGEERRERLPEQEGLARGELRAAQHELREALAALRLRELDALAGVVRRSGVVLCHVGEPSSMPAAHEVSVITRLEEELSGKMAGRGAPEDAGELRTRRVPQPT
jgi:hypothetical protein